MTVTDQSLTNDIKRANEMKKTRPKEALGVIKNAVNIANRGRIPLDMAVVYGLQSECYRYSGDLEKSMGFARSSIEASSATNPVGHLLLAEVYFAMHEHQLALDAAQESLRRQNNEITFCLVVKMCAFVDPVLALNILEVYIAEKEELRQKISIPIRYQHAKVLVMTGYKQGNEEEKQRFFRKALEISRMLVRINGEDDRIRCLCADMERKMGNYAEALEMLRGMQKVGFYSAILKAQCYSYIHEWEDGYRWLEIAREKIKERTDRGLFTQPLFGIMRHDLTALTLFNQYLKTVGSVSNPEFFSQLKSLQEESKNRLLTSSCLKILARYPELRDLIEHLEK